MMNILIGKRDCNKANSELGNIRMYINSIRTYILLSMIVPRVAVCTMHSYIHSYTD